MTRHGTSFNKHVNAVHMYTTKHIDHRHLEYSVHTESGNTQYCVRMNHLISFKHSTCVCVKYKNCMLHVKCKLHVCSTSTSVFCILASDDWTLKLLC